MVGLARCRRTGHGWPAPARSVPGDWTERRRHRVSPSASASAMTTPLRRRVRLRRRLRRLRRGAWYAAAGMLVLLALGNGLGSQLLPLAERHPQKIADWLSQRAQSKVAFDHVETE